MRNETIARWKPLIVLLTIPLAVAACGESEPGRDWAGNTVEPMSTSESTTTTAVVTPRETPTSGVVEAKIGDTVTATNKNDGSQATIKVSDARDAQPGEYDPEPEHGRLLAVDVTVTNVSAETYDTNPYFFNVIDTSGRRYDYSAFGGTDFNAATLNPGETITGTIVFDAPAGQVKVAYLPGLSQVLVTWSVS